MIEKQMKNRKPKTDIPVTKKDNFVYIDEDGNETVGTKVYVAYKHGNKHFARFNGGQLLNVNALYFVPGTTGGFNKHKGQDNYPFRAVTAECFDLYRAFLLTKNPAHLRDAERTLVV